MNERLDDIPVIIPSLEPDERLMDLIKDLKKENIQNIILINDGSSEEYNHYFEMAQKDYGCTVLRHYVNLGKGRALKNAFNYCLLTFPNLIGCVTADSDGQHRPKDIKKCMEALHATNLILGCRDFNKEDVPQKSRLGNKITRQVCKYLCGIDVSDTQTGLRAIPKKFMKELLSVSGERFEFETNMLIETKKSGVNIEEVEIQTVYDSKDNHTTHFNPIKDSIMIYKIFGRMFIEFIFSSLSSSVIDLILFAYFCKIYSNTVIFGGGGGPCHDFSENYISYI